MPRTLLLPIPHEIADKVHHALTATAEAYTTDALRFDDNNARHIAIAFETLADHLDTLARAEGVLGW